MILIIAIFILVVGFALMQAQRDAAVIEMNLHIDHAHGWRYRAMNLTMIGAVLAFTSRPEAFIVYLPLSAVMFWIVFDMRLNLLRGLDVLYVGYNAGIDKLFRSTFRRFPEEAMLVAKVISFIGLLILFLYVCYS
jgi:hypothetical protein